MSKIPPIYVAQLETEHYSFQSIGKTAEEARLNVTGAFSRHLAQTYLAGSEAQSRIDFVEQSCDVTWDDDDVPDDSWHDYVDGYYGISVTAYDNGTVATRDGAAI